jgi:Ca2+-binding EF-hand superfamily protein
MLTTHMWHMRMQHPWMAENGVASDAPLENEIQQRLKKFQDLNRFKRQALKLIASYLSPEEVSGLHNQFQALDKDGNGARHLNTSCLTTPTPWQCVAQPLRLCCPASLSLPSLSVFVAYRAPLQQHLQSAAASLAPAHAGTITVEELHEALKSTHTKLPQADIEAVMANVDQNDSGAIDYEEFLAATLHASKASSDEHLQRAFREFDDDESGAASSLIGSTLCVLAAMGKLSSHRLQKHLQAKSLSSAGLWCELFCTALCELHLGSCCAVAIVARDLCRHDHSRRADQGSGEGRRHNTPGD